MHESLHSLTRREVEVLRLLVAGHDAKSVAQSLGLSVHTVNERLRYARRKLGVSSSREAARWLAEVEQQSPKFSVDKKMGVVGPIILEHIQLPDGHEVKGHQGTYPSLAWFTGGLLFMALIVAISVMALSSALQNNAQTPAPPAPVYVIAQDAMDMMPIADTNSDGKVTPEEYELFSKQGWDVVSQGKDQVKLAELDQMGQLAFFSIKPNADGFITRQMYIDAIPERFKAFDQNGDGTLSADEINGRAFQQG